MSKRKVLLPFVLQLSLLLLLLSVQALGQSRVKTQIRKYVPPRPAFGGIHVQMPQDSAFLLMKRIALRSDTLHSGDLILLETDSVRIFGEPAYLQLQLSQGRVRTIVLNYHPLSGDRYFNLREMLNQLLERAFGRGVVTKNESVTHHRWETDDGTMEVSHSDKYMRIFVRLGKPQNSTE